MTRRHNERFRGRDEMTVFGRRAVLDALAAPDVGVVSVVVARDVPDSFRQLLRSAAEARGAEVRQAPGSEVHRLSGDARHDQGVAARVRLGNVLDLDEFVGALRGRSAGLLALDGVTNPQNVGMIVRSAVAAGMDGLVWPTVGTPWISGLVIKSSASAVFRCAIVRTGSLSEGLVALQAAGFRLCGLVMERGADLFEFRPPRRAVYIVGRETEGLSKEVEALLDDRVSIPMAGGVESLNAAVAASIVCFHAKRTCPGGQASGGGGAGREG